MKYHYKIIDRILIIILLLLSFYIIFGHALIHNFNKKINDTIILVIYSITINNSLIFGIIFDIIMKVE